MGDVRGVVPKSLEFRRMRAEVISSNLRARLRARDGGRTDGLGSGASGSQERDPDRHPSETHSDWGYPSEVEGCWRLSAREFWIRF
jgi:hypothetical protein